MKDINFSCPINPLSFGNVSYNMLKELYQDKIDINLFPIGNKVDLSSFDKADDEFKHWVTSSYDQRLLNIKPSSRSIRMWHLNGSEASIGKDQILYTFYECNQPTKEEINTCKIQHKTVFSSSYAADCFKNEGCENVDYIPIGFDSDLFETNKEYLSGKINFGIIGKFEKRKHTARLLKLWADKYGDNNDYQLTCCVNNPFFKEDQVKAAIGNALDGKLYKNINFLPFVKTNSQMNELYNAIDINIGGMSGAEGWNLPAFNSTCLGKWSIVLNCTSHKDWANKDNAIIVEPSGKEDIYDGIFFTQGSSFNQGQMYTFEDDQFYEACDAAVIKCKNKNKKGVEVGKQFTYNKTVSKLLELTNQ